MTKLRLHDLAWRPARFLQGAILSRVGEREPLGSVWFAAGRWWFQVKGQASAASTREGARMAVERAVLG